MSSDLLRGQQPPLLSPLEAYSERTGLHNIRPVDVRHVSQLAPNKFNTNQLVKHCRGQQFLFNKTASSVLLGQFG